MLRPEIPSFKIGMIRFFLTNRETQSNLYYEKSQSSEAEVGLSLC